MQDKSKARSRFKATVKQGQDKRKTRSKVDIKKTLEQDRVKAGLGMDRSDHRMFDMDRGSMR